MMIIETCELLRHFLCQGESVLTTLPNLTQSATLLLSLHMNEDTTRIYISRIQTGCTVNYKEYVF